MENIGYASISTDLNGRGTAYYTVCTPSSTSRVLRELGFNVGYEVRISLYPIFIGGILNVLCSKEGPCTEPGIRRTSQAVRAIRTSRKKNLETAREDFKPSLSVSKYYAPNKRRIRPRRRNFRIFEKERNFVNEH